MPIDKLYQQPFDRVADFSFDEKVARVFPDMIQRSVPGYSTIIAMTGILAQRFCIANSNIYDLGCSLGASLLSMAHEIPQTNNIQLIGIDNSQAMIDHCRHFTKADSRIHLRCESIETCCIENASVIAMNFSLQFIPLTKRDDILKKISDGMHDHGILILSEKVRFEDGTLDHLNIELHHDFKRANGYSDLEISQKRNALEKVLVPETLKMHQQRIRNSGFKRCDVWFQCFNFASMVAIK